MLKKIAGLLLLVVLGIVGLALTKPDTFAVQRSITIKAPPEKIFAALNDFHAFGKWSPWEKLDPNMKRTFEGAPSGVGAAYAWEGNRDVGAGRMEITESTANTKIAMKLDFTAPIKANDIAQFTLEPEGDSTKVTWHMSGPAPFVSKVMQVFVSMDSMIGKDFEKGLSQLKTLAETP